MYLDVLYSIQILIKLLLILTFSDSYKHTILPFSKNISNNINISREIYTFSEFLSNYTHILRDLLQDNTTHFLRICIKQIWQFQLITTK